LKEMSSLKYMGIAKRKMNKPLRIGIAKRGMNKRGISPLIGYVLLIVGMLSVSVLVYGWLKTYVPQEKIECSEGVSLFVKDIECTKNITNSEIKLILNIKNNGLFNVDGFLIHATNDSVQKLATIDLSSYGGGANEIILFNEGRVPLKPSEEEGYLFEIGSNLNDIKTIEIIPAKFEIVKGKKRFTSCGSAKITDVVNCV